MIIKTKSQAADQGTHGPILLAAWEAGETRVKVGGKEYELVREPEPVAMYTGEELRKMVQCVSLCISEDEKLKQYETMIDLILARRAEMLRAMGDEELVEHLADEYGEITRATSDDVENPEYVHAWPEAIALVREHIEANRPELTDEMIDGWLKEFKGHGPDAALSSLGSFIAHRAAEYRSPHKGRAEKLGAIADSLPVNKEADAEIGRIMTAAESKDYQDIENPAVAELRAENEHLKRRMDVVLHAGPATAIATRVFDRASKLELELADLNARLARTKELEAAHSPQPVDDSDEYGILVQDGCVALVHRLPRGWVTEYYISGSNVIIDPARIFKVTSRW